MFIDWAGTIEHDSILIHVHKLEILDIKCVLSIYFREGSWSQVRTVVHSLQTSAWHRRLVHADIIKLIGGGAMLS